ncbi:hypothetical protein K435DRAFT_820977 [Dendrothele bispora CBS 962.96]|uniref:MFS general substrate transporter n=1 Tax=Dendrothele bispora (strain CBS 962.96) TaxID=1314807 RepID=A0A4S8LPD0_DENBC|nr:hypothetical protein K435DRAFT_820977 [Dendrothele bispora CBS 962.96]
MLSLAEPNQLYQIFLSQGLGHGIGAGMIYVPSIAILAQYFRQRRAIVHPIILNNLLNGPLGFGNTIRANAELVSGFLLMSCLLMRTRLPPPTKVMSLLKALKKFSRDAAYIFAVAGFFQWMTNFCVGLYLPIFFVQLDSAAGGLDTTFSFYTLVILNASSFLGRLTPGLLIHKLDVGNMITGDCGCCTVMILAMMGIKTLPEFIVFGVLFGFFAGTYITMNGPLIAMLADDFSKLGAKMGVAFAFMGQSVLMGDDHESDTGNNQI